MKWIIGAAMLAASLSACTSDVACQQTRDVAKYERWVQELRAQNAISRSSHDQKAEAFQRTVRILEQRYETLERAYAVEGINPLAKIRYSKDELTAEQKLAAYDAMIDAFNAAP